MSPSRGKNGDTFQSFPLMAAIVRGVHYCCWPSGLGFSMLTPLRRQEGYMSHRLMMMVTMISMEMMRTFPFDCCKPMRRIITLPSPQRRCALEKFSFTTRADFRADCRYAFESLCEIIVRCKYMSYDLSLSGTKDNAIISCMILNHEGMNKSSSADDNDAT